jgi:hypothetical protein
MPRLSLYNRHYLVLKNQLFIEFPVVSTI